jgi:hypothetical protein
MGSKKKERKEDGTNKDWIYKRVKPKLHIHTRVVLKPFRPKTKTLNPKNPLNPKPQKPTQP